MRTKNRRINKNQQGFTIVELIIALAMSLIVMGAIYSLFTTQQKSYIHQERVATVQQNLRAAMYMMSREIRMAGCDPTGTISPAPGILTAAASTPPFPTTSNTIQFTMDITDNTGTGSPDGDVNDPGETITYTLDGTDLKRNGDIMAEYITSLTFTFEDLDNDNTAETVQIQMVAQTKSGTVDTPTPVIRTLTSNIRCRNL